MSKTVNGDNEGTFTSLLVSPDDSIVNDLTVQGTLTASGVAVSTLTGQYYTASDANYQYRFDSGTMDLKSTSSGAPTVRLLNNVNSSASTTLQTGVMTATTANATTQYSSQQNTATGTAGGAGFKSINNSSNSVEVTMRSSNHTTKPNHADILATGATSMHFGTNNSADISIRTNAAERINVADALVTVKQPISETDTTDSTSKTTGSIRTAGGVGIAKNLYVGGETTMDALLAVGSPASKEYLINLGKAGGGTFRNAYIYGEPGGNMRIWNEDTTGKMLFGTNTTEKMRITDTGQLLLGITSGNVPGIQIYGGGLQFGDNTSTAAHIRSAYLGTMEFYTGTWGVGTYLGRWKPTGFDIVGALSKGSGTFDIQHPLHPEDKTKRLVHSFIEGPRCDLIYRGQVTLQNGAAIVNIDQDSVAESDCAMTQGTFEALCANPQFFLQNPSSFSRLKGSIQGNELHIECEDPTSDLVYWQVIAERKDPYIQQWERTNPNGFLVTEYTGDMGPYKEDTAME